MLDVDWVPAVTALLLGLAGGAVLVWLTRGGGDSDRLTDARLEDLRREKDRLLQALRDLQDSRTGEATAEEREALEAQAVAVLKALDEGVFTVVLQPEPAPAKAATKGTWDVRSDAEKYAAAPAPEASPAAPRPAAAAASAPAAPSGMSAEVRGMLKGGGVVAFLAVLVLLLTNFSTERKEGMSITGAAPETTTMEVEVPVPSPGETGGSVPGVPPDLQPKSSPAVDAARAKVASDPGTIAHWVELGYALADAEGFIDAWQVAQEIEQRDPGNVDGKVIAAMVRIAMGQMDRAIALLDEAITAVPEHLTALTYRGMLAMQSGDAEAAVDFWTRARALAPTEADAAAFTELIRRAEAGEFPPAPTRQGGAMPPDHPQVAGDTPPPSPAAAGRTIEGTITLADGVTLPDGGVLYVIARQPGATRGPPAATKKMMTRAFPATFVIGDADVMMGGPFPEQVELSARFDADGDAMTRSAEDLTGVAGTVEAGTADVRIELRGP